MKLAIVAAVLLSTNVFASEEPPLFTYGEKAPNVHHQGDVWLAHVSPADDYYQYSVAAAKFAAGAKLNWHLHPKGQQLLIIDGRGYYQERGKAVKIVSKGEMIKCAPGVQHWHAAAVDSGVTYLAISGNVKTEWFEPVSEETYRAVEAN